MPEEPLHFLQFLTTRAFSSTCQMKCGLNISKFRSNMLRVSFYALFKVYFASAHYTHQHSKLYVRYIAKYSEHIPLPRKNANVFSGLKPVRKYNVEALIFLIFFF